MAFTTITTELIGLVPLAQLQLTSNPGVDRRTARHMPSPRTTLVPRCSTQASFCYRLTCYLRDEVTHQFGWTFIVLEVIPNGDRTKGGSNGQYWRSSSWTVTAVYIREVTGDYEYEPGCAICLGKVDQCACAMRFQL